MKTLIVLLLLPFLSFAVKQKAYEAGEWNDPTTWESGEVPSGGDTVFTYNDIHWANTTDTHHLTIRVRIGTLTLDSNLIITGSLWVSGRLIINGSLSVFGTEILLGHTTNWLEVQKLNVYNTISNYSLGCG